MNQQYTEAFREQALRKVFERGDRPIRAVARDLNLNMGTLKGWMKESKSRAREGAAGPDAVDGESLAGRLDLLIASALVPAEALPAWCREHGIYAHQLSAWKAAFVAGSDRDALKPLRSERDALKQERDELKRQLLRKDMALSETAALLVLSKKFQALLAGEVE